jgi:hypothetical protein
MKPKYRSNSIDENFRPILRCAVRVKNWVPKTYYEKRGLTE